MLRGVKQMGGKFYFITHITESQKTNSTGLRIFYVLLVYMDSYYKYKKYKTLYKQLRGGVDDVIYKIGTMDEVIITGPLPHHTEHKIKIKKLVTFCYPPADVVVERPQPVLEYNVIVANDLELEMWEEEGNTDEGCIWDKGMWALYVANKIQREYIDLVKAEHREGGVVSSHIFMTLYKLAGTSPESIPNDQDCMEVRGKLTTLLTSQQLSLPSLLKGQDNYMNLANALYLKYGLQDFQRANT